MNEVPVPLRIDFHKGDIVAGRYKVEKSLGEGAFGHVYEVSDSSGNCYAMKLLRLWDVPSDIRHPLVERFEMEFKTAQIDCEFLVRSIDYGLVSGNPFILMEFCPSGDLSKLVGKRDINLSKYACEILQGLHALHKNGKVHRDLKPENVLFKKDGSAALTDFGISGDRNNRMTQKGVLGKPLQIFGTYAYMPPEQVTRSRTATVLPTTDIFSFGVMMFQLITGELPFGKLEDQNDLVRYQKRGKAGDWNRDALLAVPNGFMWEPLIAGCLNPDFKNRIQSAEAAINFVPKSPVQNATSGANRVIVNTGNNRKQAHTGSRLCVMHGDDFGMVFDLTAISKQTGKLILTLGRSVNSLVKINDQYISRNHSTLETEQTGLRWIIRDGQWNFEERVWQKSTNGTYLNSTEIDEYGSQLKHGDIIAIGDVKLKYEEY
ncbi:MAG: protein kinase [Bacteroidaceae bacterium]|nr:protein kinase [Bacteroidaceae bacterium]